MPAQPAFTICVYDFMGRIYLYVTWFILKLTLFHFFKCTNTYPNIKRPTSMSQNMSKIPPSAKISWPITMKKQKITVPKRIPNTLKVKYIKIQIEEWRILRGTKHTSSYNIFFTCPTRSHPQNIRQHLAMNTNCTVEQIELL